MALDDDAAVAEELETQRYAEKVISELPASASVFSLFPGFVKQIGHEDEADWTSGVPKQHYASMLVEEARGTRESEEMRRWMAKAGAWFGHRQLPSLTEIMAKRMHFVADQGSHALLTTAHPSPDVLSSVCHAPFITDEVALRSHLNRGTQHVWPSSTTSSVYPYFSKVHHHPVLFQTCLLQALSDQHIHIQPPPDPESPT